MKNNIAYKTALGAILCAQAIALSFLEGLIPAIPFMPPGAKPGFSNIITMFAADSLGFPMAMIITLVKSGFAFITRGATASLMSLSGGVLSTVIMYLLIRYASEKTGLTGISVIGALCHNAGQLFCSAILTGNSKTFYYAPVLAVFAVLTGVLTGVILKAVYPALEKQKKYLFHIH
ncbi:MAG: Gx transporter family protein [Clostridia bacterium]|nr:Gx transporter family protein [Clostridia bacterium]